MAYLVASRGGTGRERKREKAPNEPTHILLPNDEGRGKNVSRKGKRKREFGTYELRTGPRRGGKRVTAKQD